MGEGLTRFNPNLIMALARFGVVFWRRYATLPQ